MIKSIAVVCTFIIFASCNIIDMRREKGNGNLQTDNRHETNFKGVESFGSFDVYVSTGSDYSVKIEAEENLLQHIKTRVEDGNLRVSIERGVSVDPTRPMKVYVSAPVFNRLTTAGSGNIEGQNQLISDGDLHLGISGSGDIKAIVKAKNISSDISGSGNVDLSGEADAYEASIAGNGDVKAQNLRAADVSLHISGSGNAIVHADKKLDVHIAGSGDVKYSGNPEISQHIAGSGSIQKVN